MRVAIIDYGLGNLLSVRNALEFIGVDVDLVCEPRKLSEFDGYVLPGVGAFGNGMAGLRERALIDGMKEEILHRKKPLLGICLGLQLLATTSHELGTFAGLDWVGGTVVRLSPATTLRVPHIGWNGVEGRGTLFAGIPPMSSFYFVHSYVLEPAEPTVIAGTTNYGESFVSAIEQDNVLAVQFHPEKSHKSGLMVLKNFAEFVKRRTC